MKKLPAFPGMADEKDAVALVPSSKLGGALRHLRQTGIVVRGDGKTVHGRVHDEQTGQVAWNVDLSAVLKSGCVRADRSLASTAFVQQGPNCRFLAAGPQIGRYRPQGPRGR